MKNKSAHSLKTTTSNLRYHESKLSFIEEARAWAFRNELQISQSIIDEMYLEIQIMERPREFTFEHAYLKLTNNQQ